jgi:hypothetical protein
MTKSMAITASSTAMHERHPEVVDETPAVLYAEGGHAHRRQREEQPQHDGVEHHQTQVAGPAPRFRDYQRPARRGQLPQSHDGEDTEEETEPDGRLVAQDEVLEVHGSPAGVGRDITCRRS